MTHQIYYSGTQLFITSDAIEKEFEEKFSERLTLLSLSVYTDEAEPATQSFIIAVTKPVYNGLSTFGLNIRRIDFPTHEIELSFWPSQFNCIREEYKTQLLQTREAI